jgi:hypothetical protein
LHDAISGSCPLRLGTHPPPTRSMVRNFLLLDIAIHVDRYNRDEPTYRSNACCYAGRSVGNTWHMDSDFGSVDMGGAPECAALLATHSILLLLGCLVVAFSVYSLYAAGRSTARGGGLMGPIGLFPLAIGACVSGLALWSISVALACLPQSPTDPKLMRGVADQ